MKNTTKVKKLNIVRARCVLVLASNRNFGRKVAYWQFPHTKHFHVFGSFVTVFLPLKLSVASQLLARSARFFAFVDESPLVCAYAPCSALIIQRHTLRAVFELGNS